MTYRDPNDPPPADAPTETYRAAGEEPPSSQPPAESTTAAPDSTSPWPSEHATSTSTEPVRGPARPRRGWRWAVALVVTALVVSTVAAAAFIMSGKAPNATVLGWVPADSVMYLEARLDLPGDQRLKLGEFLSKFPGFRDQSSLETKVNETLDQLISGVTNGEQTYSRDIEPWFGGEIAMSLGTLPTPPDTSDPTAIPSVPNGAMYVSLKDAAKARAWLDDKTSGQSPSTEDYNGTQITLIPSEFDRRPDSALAYAFPNDALLVLGSVDGVKAAIDTKGDGGLAAEEGFSAAIGASAADHVGFVYMNMATYMDWAMDVSGSTGMTGCGTTLSSDLLDMMPGWFGAHFRIEGDALVSDMAAPVPSGLEEVPAPRVSTIARHLPASTLAVFEGHDLGKGVLDVVQIYRDDPQCAEILEQVDAAVGLLGGFDGVAGWMGDAAVAVNRTDDGVEGGLVIQTASAEDATSLLNRVRGFVMLGGSQLGFSIREETHGDAAITILDLGDAESLSALAGMAGGVPVIPPGGAGARVELAWTVVDDLVVLSVGPNFVKHVLDTDESGSLAASDRFEALLARTGHEENLGVMFADLTAIRELAEEALRADPSFAKYTEEIQPFLVPFDAWMLASGIEGDQSQVRSIVTIK